LTGSGPITRPTRTGAGPVGKDILSARLIALCASDGVDLALYDDAVHPVVVGEFACLGSPIGVETEHWSEERSDGVGFTFTEEILVVQDRIQTPVSQLVDVSQFA
jgi:hypothetical protein